MFSVRLDCVDTQKECVEMLMFFLSSFSGNGDEANKKGAYWVVISLVSLTDTARPAFTLQESGTLLSSTHIRV